MKALQTLILSVALSCSMLMPNFYTVAETLTDNNRQAKTITCQNYDITQVTVTIKGSSHKRIEAGEQIDLSIDINPGHMSYIYQSLYWTSSDKEIAEVDSRGQVTAKQPGIVYIYVKSKLSETVQDKIKIVITQPYTQEELRLMSSLIFCEAGNQCYAGQKAVGIVVMNRVESDDFPNTIEEVIYQSGQFTPAETGFLKSSLQKYDKDDIPEDCIKAAKDVLQGSRSVYYNEETIDMSSYVFFSRYIPDKRLVIEDHQFK